MVPQFEENKKAAFAKKLRKLMDGWSESHGKKLTQDALAAAINASRYTVTGWLNEKVYPSDSAIPALCEFFGVPPTYFDPTLSQDKLNEAAKELHEYELHLQQLYEEEVKK